MSTREIPRKDWAAYFDQFNREHQGKLVVINLLGSDIGAQEEVREMPFEGITFDYKDGENIAAVIVGNKLRPHTTHLITAPTHIRLKRDAGGTDAVIEIESASGVTTLVEFLPEDKHRSKDAA